jgi:hypothetical protein
MTTSKLAATSACVTRSQFSWPPQPGGVGSSASRRLAVVSARLISLWPAGDASYVSAVRGVDDARSTSPLRL